MQGVTEKAIEKHTERIKFKTTLFKHQSGSEGNLGIRLDVINMGINRICITNLALGIANDKKIDAVYSSTILRNRFPRTLNHREKFTLFFYGEEVVRKIKQYQAEEAIFIISTDAQEAYFYSPYFMGGKPEYMLPSTNDQDVVSWGVKRFQSLDIEQRIP